jgi:glycosyltransferase involved in cell wall biosynthesis
MLVEKMHKVLIIVSDYFAGHSVGSERICKFEKYLPNYGFNTVILTATPSGKLPNNSRSKVYSTFEPGHIYRSITKYFKKKNISNETDGEIISRYAVDFKSNFLNRIRSWLLDYVLIPDLKILWLPSAVIIGANVIKHEKIDVIFSTSPPDSMHLVAACLSIISGKPWVADFRDGWVHESLKPILRIKNWRYKVECSLERWVATQADAVVSVSGPITDYFRTICPSFSHKMLTITNGYDPADWQNIVPICRDSTQFWLVHTGSISLSRMTQSIEPILNAIQLLEASIRAKLRLILVGAITETERASIRESGLSDVVKEIGQVSRSQSLAYQLSADGLLLSIGKDRSVATSKLYEYLYSRRPILAISASDTAAAEIVRETGSGIVVSPDDTEDIAACLIRLYKCWERGALMKSQSVGIERYERQELTKQLARILLEVLHRQR